MAANRTKTIEYAFPSKNSLLLKDTRYDYSAITLYIPEIASRSFKSVIVEITTHETSANTSLAIVASNLIGIKLGATAFDDVTVTDNMPSVASGSSEKQTYIFSRNVTSYFNTNFGTAESQTCQVGFQYSQGGTNTANALDLTNITAKLIITYDYDDTESLDTGTATAGGATTLTDSGKSWGTNAYTSQYVKITSGTGSGQVRKIASNTGTVLTVSASWTTNPDATSVYAINMARVKTVRIPMESSTATLTATLTEIGTNQIPLLDTFCPETSKTFRNIFIEVYGNTANANSTDVSLEMGIDGGAAHNLDTFELQQNSAHTFKYHWVNNSMSTSSAHAFKARSNNTATRITIAPVLVVTYEYDHNGSSTILNSLMLPLKTSAVILPVVDQRVVEDLEFWIEEPTTITLVQSGYLLFHVSPTLGMGVAAGGQTARVYVAGATLLCGHHSVCHRIDAGGGAGSAGITLARGKNTLVTKLTDSSTSLTSKQSAVPRGYAIINYTSGKASGGDGAHNHTVIYSMSTVAADTANTITVTHTPYIIESNWFLNALGIFTQLMRNGENNGSAMLQRFQISQEALSGEEHGVGVVSAENYLVNAIVSGVLGVYYLYTQHRIVTSITEFFKRYSTDTWSTKAALETERDWIVEYGGQTCWFDMELIMTYHSITFDIAGDVSGSGGGTVTIQAHNLTSGEKVATTTRSGDGAYALTVFDNTENYYTEAYEDSTHVGRSDTGMPT